MTDEDKALVERLRLGHEGPAADRIEALEAENERLREEVQSLTDELGYHGIYPRPLLGVDTV